jgi:pSer/pThr/pTyr-binding forkhead associated (FHA) protein
MITSQQNPSALSLLIRTIIGHQTIRCLPEGEVLLGRNPLCGIVLSEAEVSRQHAKLSLCEGKITLEDLDSNNGTYLDGKRITGRQNLVGHEIIGIGSFQLSFVEDTLKEYLGKFAPVLDDDPTQQTVAETPETPKEVGPFWLIVSHPKQHFFLSEGGSLTIGRTRDCQVIIPTTRASKRHARLSLSGGVLTLQDLNSTNGTFVDGRRCSTQVLNGSEVIDIVDVKLYLSDKPVDQTPTIDKAPASSPAQLLLLSGDEVGRPFYLNGLLTNIGRNHGNDIVLRDRGVSPFHAKIVSCEGRYHIINTESVEGFQLNGRYTLCAALNHGDILCFGETLLRFHVPYEDFTFERDMPKLPEATLSVRITAPDGVWHIQPLSEGNFMIGRGVYSSTILLEGSTVSCRHAILLVREDVVTIVDLGSEQGTLLDGERLEGHRVLTGAEVITIEGFQLSLLAQELTKPSISEEETIESMTKPSEVPTTHKTTLLFPFRVEFLPPQNH